MTSLLGLFNFNRIYMYLVLAGVVLASVGIAVLKIKASGAQAERLNQMQNTLKRKQLDAEISANLGAISAAARRKQLRDRWSRR